MPTIHAATPAATEVPGVTCIPGEVRAQPDGWVRIDDIRHGGQSIGSVQVRMRDERVSSLSLCGESAVIGRDIAWIARKSGKVPAAGVALAGAQTASPVRADLGPFTQAALVASAPAVRRMRA